MKTHFKKIIAAALSAAMLMLSFVALAADDTISSDTADTSETLYHPDTKLELHDEDTSENTDETAWNEAAEFEGYLQEDKAASEEQLEAEAIKDKEPADYTPFWDNSTSVDWNMALMAVLTDTIASGKCGDNLTWTLDSEGTLTISGTGDMYNYYRYKNVTTAPWGEYIDSLKKLVLGDGITSIGNYAFDHCSGFTGNLVIPDSVTSIGTLAFVCCSSFTGDLIIPDSVTSIGTWAFSSCSGFTGNLVIPNSVKNIGNNAFYNCSGFTGDLVIPDSIVSIEGSVFYNCSGFTGLVIPDSVTSIGDHAFYNCSSFTGSLVIPDSVTSIGSNAFYNCSGFTGLVIPDSITSIGDYAFYKCSGFAGNLTIPDGVDSIGHSAFRNCSSFTGNLVLPGSITSIGNSTFEGCNGLTDMYILKSEDSIGTGSFPNRVHWKYDLLKCTATISDQICTGIAIVPGEDSITVTSPNGKTLYYGTDYVIEGAKNNIAVGTATAHIVPPNGGISILSQDVPFNIVGIDLSGATVTFPENITWQGEPCCPNVTVVINGMTLTKDKDYTVSYSDNNGVGTGKATITGIGNYVGNLTAEFEIKPYAPDRHNPVSISDRMVAVSISGTFTYNGAVHTPKPQLVYTFINETTGVELPYDMEEGKDYNILSYENNINAGTAKIIIEGINAFKNTREIDFTISPCELSVTTIADIPSAEYCKKDICPTPEIKIGDNVMVKDVDYELSYENNRNRGTASVIITGKGNLSGTVTKNFEITPRDGSKFTIIVWL